MGTEHIDVGIPHHHALIRTATELPQDFPESVGMRFVAGEIGRAHV